MWPGLPVSNRFRPNVWCGVEGGCGDTVTITPSCTCAVQQLYNPPFSQWAQVFIHSAGDVGASVTGAAAGAGGCRHTKKQDGSEQSGHDMQTGCADPESVGRYAAQRALARLNARKISTQKVPVLFEAPLASGLLGAFVQAVSGGALYRKSSFLLDSIGQQVFPRHIQIREDPLIPGGMGSAPFDDEGVRVQARDVVSDGVVQGYFLSCYTARKLGMQSTGNAGGSHNLSMTSGLTRRQDDLTAMIRKMNRGLLLTEVMGQGVNYVTGDYSRGAFGYWIENGEIVHPVEEITIAANMKDMFRGIVAIGADTICRGTKSVGSILIDEMTIAGS